MESKEKSKVNDNGKKRKVTKACTFCQRSHMTCDNERPCQRCIKRRIGHLCVDNPPNPSHHVIAIHPGNILILNGAPPSIDFITDREAVNLKAEFPLDHFCNEPQIDNLSTRSVNWKENEIGYMSLIKFSQENFSVENQNRIAAAAGIVQPILRSTVKNLDENCIQACENFIEETLFTFDTLASSICTPFIVIRGTGEIMRVNNTFADIVKIHKNELELSWRFHEIVAEESFVTFLEKIAPLYFHVASPQSAIISQCVFIPGGLCSYRKAASSSTLDVVNSGMVPCSISISVKRDPYSLLSMIIIAVIPS